MSKNNLDDIQSNLDQRLRDGLDALDVSYGDEAIQNLLGFMELLAEWNQSHNLTSVDDPEEMLSVHILDCASIKPYLKGASLLDVGSGAGLPGMVLAILSPALQVTSVESRNKKAQFQTFAANKLAMKGAVPDDELKVIKKRNLKADTFALKVPELDAQRNLIVIQKQK